MWRWCSGSGHCRFPRICICRLHRVCEDFEHAVEDIFEHGSLVCGFLPVLHHHGKESIEQAFRAAEINYFLPVLIELMKKPISVMDGAISALDQMEASFSGDEFESAIVPEISPQPSGAGPSYPLFPIDFDQPWRLFKSNDEWVSFTTLCLQLNVSHAMVKSGHWQSGSFCSGII